jgi:radical SAM superfamily enzyme YgiQ (UPF0313 family)
MKIALIAMSGIRCRNERLMDLGLTLPGFVERSKVIASLPSLGLLTLAGMTPAEHEVRYIELPELSNAGEIPDDVDLVAISSYSAQIFEAYELAGRFRQRGVPVVLGGPHVSCLPAEASRHADAVAVGEGEAVWKQIVADAANGNLKPLYGSLNGGFDIEQSPMPDFERLDVERYNRLTVQASRGCPHRCDFCAASVLFCGRYRQKPVDRVLAEIRRITSIWRRPFIEFADDNAVVDRRYWKRLLTELRGTPLRWFAETDITVAEDDELLELMRGSGCAQVLIGLESPERESLKGVELRNDWKYKKWSRYRDAIRNIQSRGISVNGCFVLGLDGHGPEIFDRVYRFVEQAELHEVQVTILTPFPGTPLYERLMLEGRILEDGRWDRCTLFDVNFEPSGMSPEELTRGFGKLVEKLYGEEFTRWRRDTFKSYLRKCTAEGGTCHEK